VSSTRPLAVTMGEPAGIGGELLLALWARRREDALPVFVALDDPDRLAALARALGIDAPIRVVSGPEEAVAAFDEGLPVIPVPLSAPVVRGKPDPANGSAVIRSIDRAVELTLAGRTLAVVTNPIQKSSLYAAGFRHPGHTEYLAHLTGISGEPVMMLEGGGLRVVLSTIHIAIKDVPARLTTGAIVHVGRVTAAALKGDFGIKAPRLAVAALNPHAGEGGAMGREEIEVIVPAIETLRAEGIDAFGPSPSDTLFHAAARERYDAVICQYHDQGLIPLKTLDFDTGVNITLGLPIVRTSPDHGTALDLAGTGRANPSALRAAMRAAVLSAARRAALG